MFFKKELREKEGATQSERKILKPVIQKMKDDERQRIRNKIKKQRNSTGVKLRKAAKGANPLSKLKRNPEFNKRFRSEKQ